jgi:phosphoserine aminotransferase
MKKHNFSAGPSILPEYTIKKSAEAILNFANQDLSILGSVSPW